MSIVVRDYTAADVPAMIAVWNEVVEEGVAFPQEECLTPESGARFFRSRPIAASLRTARDASSASISCIRITSAGAGTSPMRAMPSRRQAAGGMWARRL